MSKLINCGYYFNNLQKKLDGKGKVIEYLFFFNLLYKTSQLQSLTVGSYRLKNPM